MTEHPNLISEAELEKELRNLVQNEDFEKAIELVDQVPAELRSRYLSRLDNATQTGLLTGLRSEDAADMLHSLPEAQAAELLDEIPAAAAADILEELPKDEQADLVAEMPARSAEAILDEMEDSSAAEIVRNLASYDEEEAGAIMVAEFLSFNENDTVEQAVEHLRQNAEEYSDFDVQYAYVTGKRNQLAGVLRLRDLLLSKSLTRLAELMIKNPLSIDDKTSTLELHEFFEEHNFVGVPVTDANNQLVGVVRREDVEKAMADRNADDYLKSQGIIREELRTMPVGVRSRRRLAWLSINIVLNIIAASVIAFYQDTLTQVIALAVFLPIISDMSGCSGNQAVAVSMRELSLGLVKPTEVLRVWLKEVSVGLINGLVLGLLIAAVAWVWQGNPYLGAVVGSAMMLNTVIAVSLGGTLPLIMRRLNMDPALASGPILTTVTDMCGFFLVLSLASVFLKWLV